MADDGGLDSGGGGSEDVRIDHVGTAIFEEAGLEVEIGEGFSGFGFWEAFGEGGLECGVAFDTVA